MKKLLTLRRASGVISAENSQGSFPKRGTANSIASAIGKAMALEMQGRSSDGYSMDWLWPGLYHALAMLWATFWALVLGFTISGVLQVFVSKEQISRAFGQTNLKSVSLATGLGAASSSCSYAAVAAWGGTIQQGAALFCALSFLFSPTQFYDLFETVLHHFMY